jgi:hypothetical protein
MGTREAMRLPFHWRVVGAEKVLKFCRSMSKAAQVDDFVT